MKKIIIPAHPLPAHSNKDLLWIYTQVKEELEKEGRMEDAEELKRKIGSPPPDATYADLLQIMRQYVEIEFASGE